MNVFSKINRFLFPYAGEYEKLGAKNHWRWDSSTRLP